MCQRLWCASSSWDHSSTLRVPGTLQQQWVAGKSDLGLIVIMGFNLWRWERRKLSGVWRCPGWQRACWPARLGDGRGTWARLKQPQPRCAVEQFLLSNSLKSVPLLIFRALCGHVCPCTEGFAATLLFLTLCRAHLVPWCHPSSGTGFYAPNLCHPARAPCRPPTNSSAPQAFPASWSCPGQAALGKAGGS